MHSALPPEFFNRPPKEVARELLGKYLVKSGKGGVEIARMITEVEAYGGSEDLASHARFGKTKRNAPMFGPGGVWYVYLTYGLHWLLNVTMRGVGEPSAVLIRGVEGISGPGRLTKEFGITGDFSGKSAAKSSGLWIEDRGIVISPRSIKKSPRIGVDYAGSVWSKKELRLFLETRKPLVDRSLTKDKKKSGKNGR